MVNTAEDELRHGIECGILVTDKPKTIFGDQSSRRHQLETEFISQGIFHPIGKHSDGAVVVIECLESVRGFGAKTLAPRIADENVVGGVEIIAVAVVKATGIIE